MTFSIVIETANLALADLDNLEACVQSLERQDVPITDAEQVVLLNSGDVEPEVADSLRRRYPFLAVDTVPPGTAYTQMKLLGTERMTGDVVVWADADCRYVAGWLRSLLTPLKERSDVEVVRGETTMEITGPWTLANALSFTFPRFSEGDGLTPVAYYHANNVAFRRSLLERVPLVYNEVLYRSHFIQHSMRMRAEGCTIWRQPQARAFHAAFRRGELLRRLYHIGTDSVRTGRFLAGQIPPARLRHRLPHIRGGWLRQVRRRFRLVARRQPLAAAQLPLALPFLAASGAAFYTGRLVALVESPRRS
jgi:glycosyltransferase involved in cell wall biosynthesis